MLLFNLVGNSARSSFYTIDTNFYNVFRKKVFIFFQWPLPFGQELITAISH